MSETNTGYDFFRNNTDLQSVAPLLRWVAVILSIVVAMGILNSLYYRWQARSLAWKRFYITARRYALHPSETNYMRRLYRKSHLSSPSRILIEKERFEELVHPYEVRGRRHDTLHIHSIRQKLFGRSLQKNEKIHSTHGLPVGTRLLIRPLDQTEITLRGNLVDVDDIGLIVVIPADPHIRVPLAPDTNLEITATLVDQPPTVFRTWVKSAIPGPRRMVVLGHSSFVLEKRRVLFGEKTVGPQEKGNPAPEPVFSAAPHRPKRLSH